MEDKEIIELYFSRSQNAITETASKYGDYCYTVANNILDNTEDSEESVNDTYLAAWNCIPPEDPKNFRAFLGRITRNLSLKRLRSRYAQKRGKGQVFLALDELSDCVSSNNTVDIIMDNNQLAAILDKFLSELKIVDRQIFVKRYWYFCSVSSIAETFKFTESKVKSNLHRTRKRLKIYLEKEGVYIEN